MGYLFRCLFVMFIVSEMVADGRVTVICDVILLLYAAAVIFRIKFINSIYIVVLEMGLSIWASFTDPYFAFLLSACAYDLCYARYYALLAVPLGGGLYSLKGNDLLLFLLVSGICVLFAFMNDRAARREALYKSDSDKERLYARELERTRDRLAGTANEIAHITEIKERNRIAREIHDNVGHRITGILVQLQASAKLRGKDDTRSDRILDQSVKGLAEAVNMLRETVHNIKPARNYGIEYIKDIVGGFTYCPVDFRHAGDFASIPPGHMEILGANLKEALTNCMRHSGAARVDISVETNEAYTRLYIKDDGKGSGNIREGLGLSGMRQRVANAGGTFSVSNDSGFLVVCVIPKEGGVI